MSGNVGDLSEEQKVTLEEFRTSLADVLKPEHDDYFLLRWLRARKFDKSKAETMLRKNFRWRKQHGVDTILNDYTIPEVVEKYYPYGFLGFDKEGCPVRIVSIGRLDFKGMLDSTTDVDSIRCLAAMFEDDIGKMRQESKKRNKIIDTHVYIIDYENFSLMQVTSKKIIERVREILRTYEANYPEYLKAAIFINAPNFMSMIQNIIKPFLAEETMAKFQIYGKEGWKEALRNIMEPEDLPQYLGGSRVDTDGNPRCPSVVNPGGEIPKSYFLKNRKISLCFVPYATTIVIEPKSTFSVDICIVNPESAITWEYQTKDFDISVGLFYKNEVTSNGKGSDLEEMIRTSRPACDETPVSGLFLCEKTGTYVLLFDNRYSWMRPKTVTYRVKVLDHSISSSYDF